MKIRGVGNSTNYDAVLPDGLKQVSSLLAAIPCSSSNGLNRPPRLSADKLAKLPVSRQLDTSRYPEQRMCLLDALHDPVTCVHWSTSAGASTNSSTPLAGSALPVPDSVDPADLIGACFDGTSSRVAIAPGSVSSRKLSATLRRRRPRPVSFNQRNEGS